MSTPPNPSSSIRERLAGTDCSGRFLWSDDKTIPLAGLLNGSTFSGDLAAMAGRSILLITREQLSAATALIELAGIARRIVICPPDITPEQYPVLIEKGEVDVVVSDYHLADLAGLDSLTKVRCALELTASATAQAASCATEWVLLTSGTTSMPKMIAHTLATLTAPMSAAAPAPDGQVWATFYDIRRYGGMQIFLRGFLGSGSLAVQGAAEPLAGYLTRLGEHGVTHLSGTPSHWRRVLMSPHANRIAPGNVRLSGEIADQAILNALHSFFPQARITHAFASTEAGVAFEVKDGKAGFPSEFLGRHGDVEMKLNNDSLCIRSNRVASRYLDDENRMLADSDGFVDTGDIVERTGDRFYFLGRRNGVINVGGLKVYPEEVEAVLNRHPAVRMSRVRPRRNPITGSLVAAEVMLLDGDQSEEVREELLSICRQSLPSHKVPASLRCVTTLDVAPAGKLARNGA